MFFFGRRHFAVWDDRPAGPGRRALFWVAAVVLVLSFTPAPVR
jgi:hypothetical protein